MATHRGFLADTIILFSVSGIYLSLGESRPLAFFSFLTAIIGSLILYQSFGQLIPKTPIGILGYFFGRILFIGVILYIDSQIMYAIKSGIIQKDGISAYGIAGEISSRYSRGKRSFYRHFKYIANGRILESTIRFSYDLKRGDTLYLKYSKSHPNVIKFEDNEHNRRHGILTE